MNPKTQPTIDEETKSYSDFVDMFGADHGLGGRLRDNLLLEEIYQWINTTYRLRIIDEIESKFMSLSPFLIPPPCKKGYLLALTIFGETLKKLRLEIEKYK